MSQTLPKSRSYRAWGVRTVVVRLSRKLTATYRIRTGRLLSRLLTAMLSGLSTLATALPEGASLVAGQATVSTPSANAMVVTQGSEKAILNWQAFNIGTGQSVQFVQPSAASAALNRVVGANPSSVYGSLTANGQVFLINPAGVMFAPGAQVNVGALVASTLSIGNEDFVAGRYIFSNDGSAGTVTNHGSISAARGGYVLLAAPGVSNTGTIQADGGAVGLVAGSRVSIDTSGVGLVSFSVDAAAANAVAANSGVITANAGQVAVLASALGDAMATVVNQTGVIRATSATERNGMIVLSGGRNGVVHVAGTLDASGTAAGQSGGTVQVLGDKVLLATGAHIDVSGQAGGGTVLVGGDYQGSNGAVQNATRTHVAVGTTIRADALDKGNGGKVVIWADGDTRSAGSISARGGSTSGNGGFVEVSGKQYLDTRGNIDVTAPQGVGGNVLFDPQDIVLSTAASSPSVVTNQAVNTPDLAFATAPDPGTYTVQISTVTGFNELFLQATRDISVNNALSMAANGSVRLEANNNISVATGAAIAVTGTGSINLKADADSSGAGTLSLAAALGSQAGGITLSGASVTSTAAGAITTTGAGNGDAGAVSITASGAVNLSGTITASGGTAGAGLTGRNGGVVTVSGAGGVTTAGITASGSSGGTGNTNGGSAGTISVTNNTSGNISVGALTASTGNAAGTGLGGTAGSITVTNSAAGNLTTGAITTAGGTKAAGGNIVVAGANGTVATGNVAASGGTAVGTSNGLNAGTINISGTALTLGASTMTANGTNGSTLGIGGNGGAITLAAGSGAVSGSGAISAIGGNGAGSGRAGGSGGAVTASSTGSSVALGSVNTAGGNGVAGVAAGGNAGAITHSGVGITVASNLSAVGGTASGGAAAGSGGAVQMDAGTGAYTQNDFDINAGTGPITVTADTVAISNNTLNNALTSSGTVTIKAKTANRAMSLAGASAFDISGAEITAIATGATGPIVIGDTASSGVLTIGNNIGLSGKTLTLNAGSITDTGTQTITATNVTLNANGNIGSSGDRIDVVATNLGVNTTAGGSAFVATGAINMGVGTAATNVAGTLDLLAGGAVTQTASTGNITAGTLKVQNSVANSPITLTNSGNNATTVNLQATLNGAIQYTSGTGFDVAAVTTGGNATLSAGGTVTQSGAISASGLALTGAGGNHTLRHTGNAVSTLAANTGSIDYSQAGALTVGTVAGVVGVTTAVAAKIETTGAASDLTLTNAVTSNGTGDAIVLKAGSSNAAGTSTGGKFIMDVGGSIAASAGRYLVYSGDPATTTEGVTGYNKRYNTSSSFTPGGSANMFLYRIAPTLTINADNATRIYGDANPVFTGSPTTGFIDGDTDASVGVFRSTTAVYNTPVAAGPIAITPGATNNENYTLVLNNGLLTITRRSITGVTGIVASDKPVDGNTSATLNSGAAGFSNMVLGDMLNVATANGSFGSSAVGSNKTVFISGITLAGDSSDNYTLLDSTARTTASIRDLSSFTGALFPVPSHLPALPKAFATSGMTVASANSLLESAPTASGGNATRFTMLREPAEGEEGSASVTVTSVQDGSGSSFRFSLPADFLGGGGPLQASTPTGGPLPGWLRFDPASRVFVASGAPASALPLQIRISVGDRSVLLTISDASRAEPPRGVLVERRAPVPADGPV